MIPIFEDFLFPFLYNLKNGEISKKEMRNKLIEQFCLTEEDVALRTRGGRTTQLNDRIGWCRQYFRWALFIDIPKNGVWRLTDRGEEYLSNHNALRIEDLLTYKEFAEHYNKDKNDDASEVSSFDSSKASLEITPTDALEDAYTRINDSLADELKALIMSLSPSFFETLVVDLLVAMGYGGDFKDAAEVTQQSKDGGVDGIIKEDKLGLDKIYIQAKRWNNSVGVQTIQQFAGALDGVKASKGVFITTSFFTEPAKKYVDNLSKKIVLIDGNELTSLMIEYNLGVSVKKEYIVKRIDTDYFDELE